MNCFFLLFLIGKFPSHTLTFSQRVSEIHKRHWHEHPRRSIRVSRINSKVVESYGSSEYLWLSRWSWICSAFVTKLRIQEVSASKSLVSIHVLTSCSKLNVYIIISILSLEFGGNAVCDTVRNFRHLIELIPFFDVFLFFIYLLIITSVLPLRILSRT